jgi:hypothetical protein
MNKLKNIGISALAGTLVSLSAAQAGGVSVTGSWELSLTDTHSQKVTGNRIGMNKNIAFGASGDVSDGGAVTWATTIGGTDAMGLSSASMNINMGGIATLAYDSGTGGYGANSVDNIVPTAWEEVDYGFDTGITDLGAVSKSKGVVNLTIKAPTAGTGISYSYVSRMSGAHIADGGTSGDTGNSEGHDLVIDFVDYNSPHFGFRWGIAGEVELVEQYCGKDDKAADGSTNSCTTGTKGYPYGGTSYATIKLGPASFGAQATFKDPMEASTSTSAIKNKRSIVAGAAFTVGETMSFSYGEAWDRYRYNNRLRARDGDEYETITFRGWSAAVNFGPVAIKGTQNRIGGVGEGGSTEPRKHSEINLSIAF